MDQRQVSGIRGKKKGISLFHSGANFEKKRK